MIVVMAAHATEEQIKDVEQRIADWGYGVHPIYGTERTVIGATGVPEADKARYMESLEVPAVCRAGDRAFCAPTNSPAGRFIPKDTVIDVKGIPVGGNQIALMAGPCTVETYEQTWESAVACKAAGATILRGGAYKPSTSPYSFQGHGRRRR